MTSRVHFSSSSSLAGAKLYDRFPEKSPPADNLPAKIRPARRPSWRGGFLPVNCRPGRLFWRQFYNGDTLLWGRRYCNKGETYQFRDYLSGRFFMGRHFNVTPAPKRALRHAEDAASQPPFSRLRSTAAALNVIWASSHCWCLTVRLPLPVCRCYFYQNFAISAKYLTAIAVILLVKL